MSNFSILYIVLSAFLVSAGVVVHATQSDAADTGATVSGAFTPDAEG